MPRPAKSSPLAANRAVSSPKIVKKHDDYTSEGVKDNDVFLLPGSDYQVMILVTFVAAVVRLFRIYQPSSVVFDEVQ
jgi:dolichyl-phosphate-mannose-protein mannosyltransferase